MNITNYRNVLFESFCRDFQNEQPKNKKIAMYSSRKNNKSSVHLFKCIDFR